MLRLQAAPFVSVSSIGRKATKKVIHVTPVIDIQLSVWTFVNNTIAKVKSFKIIQRQVVSPKMLFCTEVVKIL